MNENSKLQETELHFRRSDENDTTIVTCWAINKGAAGAIWVASVKWRHISGSFDEIDGSRIGDITHETFVAGFVHAFMGRDARDKTPQGFINKLLAFGFVKTERSI